MYSLLYQKSDSQDTYLLKIVPVDGTLLVHLLVRSLCVHDTILLNLIGPELAWAQFRVLRDTVQKIS